MFFFGFGISRMHKEYFKNIFRFCHIFATKLSFKVSAPATPSKDDLLSLGPEQAVTSLQESSTLPASWFQCFIVFPYKLDRFSDYLRQKMIDFVWKNNETLKWRIDDPWSDVMAYSGASNSRSYSSKHPRNTKTEKKFFKNCKIRLAYPVFPELLIFWMLEYKV